MYAIIYSQRSIYGLLLKLVIGIRFFLKNTKNKKYLNKVLHEILNINHILYKNHVFEMARFWEPGHFLDKIEK